MGALLPQVEVTFVMPSLTLGKESSGVDLESFIPDSSSIVDDLHFGGKKDLRNAYKCTRKRKFLYVLLICLNSSLPQ